MGRAKLNMELISNEKSRKITFKKRKEGLIRKMHEFTTLCDVSACMIIYGPKQQEKGPTEAEIWPQNLDEFHRIIKIYKAKNKDAGNKTFGLSDFFHDRKRKIEEELAKLRKKNMEAKYPTWLELLNFMTEAQLREFAAALSNKAKHVKSRIEMLRIRNKAGGGLMDMNLMMDFTQSSHTSSFYPPPGIIMSGGSSGIELEVVNHHHHHHSLKPIIHDQMHVPSIHYPPIPIDHHCQELHSAVNQNSMMMLLMNENDGSLQFVGPSTSSNIQCASFNRQVFYESESSSSGPHGVVDPMICPNPRPLARFYVEPAVPPPPPPPPPPYMQCTMMPGVLAPPPQLHFSIREKNNNNNNDAGGQEDIVQYLMKNHRARYHQD